MEALTTAQKTAVTKSSTDRLRLILMRYGFAEEVVLAWPREELMNKYAELLAQGVEPPTARAADAEVEKERLAHEKEMKQMEIEQQKLEQQRQLEEQKLQQELQLAQERIQQERQIEEQKLKQMELQIQQQKLEQELQLEKQRLIIQERLEMERLAIEKQRLVSENELKAEELKNKQLAENDEAKVLKRYGDALAQVISSQPEEVTDLPAYFRGVETQFDKLGIPLDYRARLIYKYLSPRARALCSRLDVDVGNDYQKVKDAVMKEYGLSAKCFLTKFNTLRKSSNDTYILFASKLSGLLQQYLEARKVTELDSLVSLLISDRIKSALSGQCLRYVLSVENSQTAADRAQWLKPSRLAELVDEYIATVGPGFGPGAGETRASYIGQPQPAGGWQQERERAGGATAGPPTRNAPTGNANIARNDNWNRYSVNSTPSRRPLVKNTFGRTCSICESPYHLKAACDKGVGSSVRVNNADAVEDNSHLSDKEDNEDNERSSTEVAVNRVVVEQPVRRDYAVSAQLVDNAKPLDALAKYDCMSRPLADCNAHAISVNDDECIENIMSLFHECECSVTDDSSVTGDVSMTNVQFDLHRFIADSDVSFHFVDLNVRDDVGTAVKVNSLFDSGTQLSVLRKELAKALQYDVVGKVKLRGFDGNVSVGELTVLHTSLTNREVAVPMKFVVCENVNYDCLLSLADYRKLLKTPEVRSSASQALVSSQSNDGISLPIDQVHTSSNVDDESTSCTEETDNNDPVAQDDNQPGVLPLDNLLPNMTLQPSRELIDEQQADETLHGAFHLAKQNKGGYFTRNELLFHRIRILGNMVERLVVPLGRRAALLQLAHDQVGGHLGIRRTKERIGLNFTWPTIVKDVIEYCRCCEVCQKRAPITYRDRVPIEGGVVSVEPVFSHFYVDALGPLFNHKTDYNYCLVFLDHTSRFPHAVALRSLTAKNCCEAMLSLWQFTGMPTKVTTDRASNFTGELTQEFMRRVGCSPIWCTPRHPEANSVERTVGTIKAMISKVAEQYPRSWWRYIGMILFALRESPNETTNVPPFTLVYGRLPHGPLSVLKNMWINENEFPVPKNKSTVEFLTDLRDRLETARLYAESHAERAQKRYVDRYNRRSCDKAFSLGESVLVLQKDSTASKVFSRWIGPATVVEIQSPHSYLIEFEDGSRRILHANHLRKFYTKTHSVTCDISLLTETVTTNTCSVIYDKDCDFGEIHTPEIVIKGEPEEDLPSQRIEREALAHLTTKQQKQLLQLLDRFAECFSDVPGLTTRVQHVVQLMSGFKPKRMRAYKVPERLQPEVERQLGEMVANGIIRESNSPMASPLVCVLKGKGGCNGVRLAIDYRFVNRYTVNDAFPIPDIEDVIQNVGAKRWISTFDCRSGYYQTPVREQDKWLTAFICQGRLWEFNRTPFGMRNAGQTFVRAMQMILRPLKEFADSYVDDSAVMSDEWHSHLTHLEKFLVTMKTEGITLNLKKCHFAQHNVKFCGEIIGSGFRRPDPEKVSAIHDMMEPVTKKQLRGVLGFFSYFRRHIEAFADKARLLTDLTSKRVPQNIDALWSERHSEALNTLKAELVRACESSLHVVQLDRPYDVYVDTSGYAISGILTQKDGAGIEYPIAFFSSKLTPTQKNWATIEREAYAVLVAVMKYRHWFFGSKVTIHSDHNPLTYLTESAPKSSKLMRWSLALAEFNLEFCYLAGKHNVPADTLSRPGSGRSD